MHSFFDQKVPSEPYVRMVCQWKAITDNMYITGILPHTTLLSEIENLKCNIECFKVYVTRDIKEVLKDKLNVRDISGTGFVQSNIYFSQY